MTSNKPQTKAKTMTRSDTMFLVSKNSELKNFTFAKDREFFSVPVEVRPLYSDVATKQVYVESPLQGGVIYPVCREHLHHWYWLSNAKQASARTI